APAAMRGERLGQRAEHLRIDDVRLRAREREMQQRAVALERDAQRGFGRSLGHARQPFFAFGWIESCSGPTQLSPAASFWRRRMKSTSRSSLVPALNAVKPARASVIMFSASQAREFSLFL